MWQKIAEITVEDTEVVAEESTEGRVAMVTLRLREVDFYFTCYSAYSEF